MTSCLDARVYGRAAVDSYRSAASVRSVTSTPLSHAARLVAALYRLRGLHSLLKALSTTRRRQNLDSLP